MKKLLLHILIFSITYTITAQKRYYPNLANLVKLEDQASIPKELGYIKKWYDESTDNIFYKDFQFSNNSRNSAIFKSLGLILKTKKKFEFGKSGLSISFDNKIQKKDNSIRIMNNHYWKSRSYGVNLDIDIYDPEENLYIFLLLQRVYSLSEEQMTANFINIFTEPIKNQSALNQFIEDINEKNNINIISKKDMTLRMLSKEIRNKMPKSFTSIAAYNTYIKANDTINTRKNIQRFYRSFTPRNIEDIMNEIILPNGDITFLNKDTKINLPKKYFKYSSKKNKEQVSFYLHKIEYDLDYDYTNHKYFLSVKLFPKKESDIKGKFKFKNIFLDFLSNGKEKKGKVEVEKKYFKNIEIKFYPKIFSIFIETENNRYIKLSKDFKTE